jgi:hypothetical protein
MGASRGRSCSEAAAAPRLVDLDQLDTLDAPACLASAVRDPRRNGWPPWGTFRRSQAAPATSATRPPRSKPTVSPSAKTVQPGIAGAAAISPHIKHANLGITSVYLQGIDGVEIVDTVRSGPAPVISASAGLTGR